MPLSFLNSGKANHLESLELVLQQRYGSFIHHPSIFKHKLFVERRIAELVRPRKSSKVQQEEEQSFTPYQIYDVRINTLSVFSPAVFSTIYQVLSRLLGREHWVGANRSFSYRFIYPEQQWVLQNQQ